MFSSPTEYFRASKRTRYLKNDSWHNQFREQVVMRVDESISSVLYTEGKVAPNAPIRVLAGMMILKEGQGWSDEQLFENCEYNLLIRSVLGLMSLREEHIFKKSLPREVFALIESIQGEKGEKVIYRGTKEEIDTRMVELGKLMRRFIGLFKKHDYGSKSGNVSAEGRATDGIVQINTTYEQDTKVQGYASKTANSGKAYNASSFNCSTFAESALKTVFPKLDASQYVKVPFPLNAIYNNTRVVAP